MSAVTFKIFVPEIEVRQWFTDCGLDLAPSIIKEKVAEVVGSFDTTPWKGLGYTSTRFLTPEHNRLVGTKTCETDADTIYFKLTQPDGWKFEMVEGGK